MLKQNDVFHWKALLKEIEQDIDLQLKVIEEIPRLREPNKYITLGKAYEKLASLRRIEKQLRRNLSEKETV